MCGKSDNICLVMKRPIITINNNTIHVKLYVELCAIESTNCCVCLHRVRKIKISVFIVDNHIFIENYTILTESFIDVLSYRRLGKGIRPPSFNLFLVFSLVRNSTNSKMPSSVLFFSNIPQITLVGSVRSTEMFQ